MDSRDYLLTTVKSKITEIDPDARIILFGSRARGDFYEDSDWDFLILTKLSVNQDLKNRISDSLFETELETENVLTGLVHNMDSWSSYSNTPVFKNISRDGIEI
ncbi:MAG: nucleotidyltransferase domain-containing protein [Bacteroidota bacterium]